MLDVRRLQVLQAVVASGSVTAAARNLGYTPSAISQQMAILEKEAGATLLERVGRGVQPTSAGRLLSEHAIAITDRLADAERALADLLAGRTGRLGVRYFATAGAALLPAALARLRKRFPEVRVDLKLIDPQDPLPEVVSGRADVAIVVRQSPSPPEGVHLVHVRDDPFCAVLPAGHRLANRRVLDLIELAEEAWVNNEWPAGLCSETMLAACAEAGFRPRFTVEADDYATAQGFVAAGLGVSVMPRLGVGSRNPDVVVRRLRNPEPVRRIYAAVRRSAPVNPALSELIDALAAAKPLRL